MRCCDELRGGMDASQYKGYVLSLLFIKYISDKYTGQKYVPINVPAGESFADVIAMKGTSDIGDQINKKIIVPLAAANQSLNSSDFSDFNDPFKLGDGKERTERLTTVNDLTCGSELLLLKVSYQATEPVTLYGQEKDSATSGLARMNMILHNNPTAVVQQGNTQTDHKFKDGDTLKLIDFVVDNPPFSDSRNSR